LLFGAQLISLLGSGVTTVGLALFAYQLVSRASATAIIGNALIDHQILPTFALGYGPYYRKLAL